MIKIGKRVYKTAIAVAFCLLIYLILMLIEYIFNIDRNSVSLAPTNWYTPFFAGIATVYAMQQNPEGSIRQAKIRSIGSIIGGYFGAIVIFFFELIYLSITKESNIHVFDNDLLYRSLQFLVTALGIILLIPFTVKLKFQNAVFISCLTYLSVTISIRNGGMKVFLFATNRILSTIIGVLISLAINSFPYIRNENKNILFIFSLQRNLLDDKQSLSPYCTYKINNLIIKGCHISFMTTKALTSFGSTFKNIKIKDPIIIMNGCALFNPVTRTYKSIQAIDINTRKPIEEILKKYNINYFSYLVNNGDLNCYYSSIKEEGSLNFYNTRKDSNYYAFVEAIAPSDLQINQYAIVEKKEIVEKIINDLKASNINEKINIVTYPYINIEGYSFLKINTSSANKENAIMQIKKDNPSLNYTIAIGSGRTDIEAMKQADYSICLSSSPDYVKEVANYIIPSNNPDDLIKFINKIYKSKSYKNYLKLNFKK